MQEFLDVVSAMSDPNRLRLLLGLRGRELCVCNLVDFIGLADSTVSKHMSILKQAGLVESHKKGRWVYYRLAGPDASPLVRQVIELVGGHLGADKIIAGDCRRINDIVSLDGGRQCQQNTVSSHNAAPVETPAAV